MDLFATIDRLKTAEFTSPLGVWEDFVKGHIWGDIQKELCCWLASTWELLEDVDDPIEAAKLRGRARAVREMLDMPTGIIRMIEDQREEN